MSIANTTFFNTYQNNQGLIYAKSYNQVLNPIDSYQGMINSRQLLIGNMTTSEVNSAVNIINSSLQAENSFLSLNSNPLVNVFSALNTFFKTTYNCFVKDFFIGLANTINVAWSNSFKDAWQKSINNELVQHLGFATWNGSGYVFYPPYSSITNLQNTAAIIGTSINTVTLSGYGTNITNFALPGYIVVSSSSSSLPTPPNISLATSVIAIANTNILQLSGPLGSATSLFAFRPLRNAEYLEFRFGTSSITGLAATVIFNPFILNVTLITSLGIATASVGITTNSTNGRINIGTYGLPTYQTTQIVNIGVASTTVINPYLQTLEVWVKSIN